LQSSYFFKVSLILTSISLVLITILEVNFSSFIIPILSLIISVLVLYVIGIRKKIEYLAFIFFFSVGLFWISISTFFRIYLFDYAQNTADAFMFYQRSIDFNNNENINELLFLTEGSLAIFIWKSIYRFFFILGFNNTPLIGLIVNNIIMSLTAIIGVKIINTIFENKIEKAKNFILYFSSCGMFWMFSSVHVRDSFIVLFVSLLFFFAIRQMIFHSLKYKIYFLLSILLFSALFPFLRSEFYFIPAFIFFCTFLPSILIEKKKIYKYILFFILCLSLFLFFSSINLIEFNPFEALIKGQKGYQEEVDATASASSLGVKLIIDQQPIIRFFAGFLYLQIYPIPFWYGFKTDTIYDFYKSINLFFLWFTLSSIYVCFREINKYKLLIKKVVLFSFFVYVFMVFAIAMSSLETRHLAPFLVPLIIVACTPDYKNLINRKRFKTAFASILFFIFLVHLSWFILKYT